MAHHKQHNDRASGFDARMSSLLILSVALALATLLAGAAQAQQFSVIHAFSGSDGAIPEEGLTIDAGGNLYGTTFAGGSGYGTVFRLASRTFVLNTLYSFRGAMMALARGVGCDSGLVAGFMVRRSRAGGVQIANLATLGAELSSASRRPRHFAEP